MRIWVGKVFKIFIWSNTNGVMIKIGVKVLKNCTNNVLIKDVTKNVGAKQTEQGHKLGLC